MTQDILSPDALEAAIRDIGAHCYHNLHPFHHALRDGHLNKGQIQAWALNRYCYQAHIPMKDATLIAKLPTPQLRREWRRRLGDHDGAHGKDGGVERWLKLTDGLGLDRDYVTSLKAILPATYFAVKAYVDFVRDKSVLEAIASSLTELFSPTIISQRVAGMLRNYDFIHKDTLAYFTPRLTQAPADSKFALSYVKAHAKTHDQQQAVLEAVRYKCHILWALLDALDYAYRDPGHIPPDAFVPHT